MTVVNTTGGPARIAPLATETTRWYAVDGTPALAADDGQLFVPNTVKVWHRPFKGWAVTISGQRFGDAKLAARVFAESRGDQLPAWAQNLVTTQAAGAGPDQLLQQIERYARDYVDLPHPDAEREDIERQVIALATAAALALKAVVRP